MGCWNGTCGISNLPIVSGDKIVLFIIKYNKYGETNSGGFCYTTGQYSPITVPVFGEYNDYGGIEPITKNGDIVFEHFMGMRHEFKVDESELARNRLIGTPENIDDLINNYIERGVYENLGFMMVLEEVYNEMLVAFLKEKEKYVAGAHKFISAYKKKEKELESLDPNSKEYFFLERDLNHPYSLHTFDESYKNLFIRACSSTQDNQYLLKSLVMKLPHQTEDDLLHSIVDLFLMEYILHELRKFWTIQSGAGSQAEDYDLHQKLANTVLLISEKKKNRWEEYWEENEDD